MADYAGGRTLRTTPEISTIHNQGHITCPPGWRVDEEYLPYHRLYYCYEGEAVYRSRDTVITLQPGSFHLLPLIRPYAVSQNPDHPLRTLWFHITLNQFVLNDILILPTHGNPDAAAVLQLLENRSVSRSGSSVIRNALNILLFLFAETQTLETVSDERVRRAIAFIESNFHRRITNAILADYIGIDHRHFIRLFKRHCGTTPGHFLTEYRIHQAVRLLAAGYPVWETAEQVGYEDAKAFSRAFKVRTGKAPVTFRKSYFLQP